MNMNFFIPNSPIPFLINEDSIFFGEIGYIYTIKKSTKSWNKVRTF